jgi:acyl carrier protein
MQCTCEAGVVNNLGYADVWDGIDIVRLIEESFDVKIADAEAQAVSNVGQLYDLLRQKIPFDQTSYKCASAVVFYRLRSALAHLGVKGRLGPTSDLSSLSLISVRKLFRSLASNAGLVLPRPSATWIGRIGQYLFVTGCWAPIGFIGLLIYLAVFKHALGLSIWWVLSAWLSILAIAIGMMASDPAQLPKGCETLGGLVKRTADQNFGRLWNLGVRQRDVDLWQALVEVVASFNDFPVEQIGRDTYFYESSMKDHLKRVA